MGLVAAGSFLFSWWRGRGTYPDSLGGFVVLSLVVGDALILLNLPATTGVPLYPLGDLQFIPAFLLAFAVGKFGAISVKGEATAIGNRVSLLILLFVPASMVFYFTSLLPQSGAGPAFLHVLLVASPLALAFYMISFIFLRPTAVKMDETLRRLAEEKERADTALASTEKARSEIEALSRFTHLVNSYSDLSEIFKEISKYVYENFSIGAIWLFLPDEREELLHSFKAHSYTKVSDEVYRHVQELRIPLNESGGVASIVWKRKKPLYLPHFRKFEFEFDRKIVELTGAVSFLHVPLVVHDKTVALMMFSNLSQHMPLTKGEIRTIDTFCAQVAGVVNTAHLLRQTEKQKADTASLNDLVKSLNENLDLGLIMQKVHSYVKERFGIQYYSIVSANAERTHLRLLAQVLPDFVTEADRARIQSFTVPMRGAKGGNGLVLRSRKPLYFAEFDQRRLGWITEDERFIASACRSDANRKNCS
ncbi:MAG: GAF domain-containing protein [Spirochaetia bacterium]|nr:GAF domain-containing protein [Spirochaetia bacterium]